MRFRGEVDLGLGSVLVGLEAVKGEEEGEEGIWEEYLGMGADLGMGWLVDRISGLGVFRVLGRRGEAGVLLLEEGEV